MGVAGRIVLSRCSSYFKEIGLSGKTWFRMAARDGRSWLVKSRSGMGQVVVVVSFSQLLFLGFSWTGRPFRLVSTSPTGSSGFLCKNMIRSRSPGEWP